MRLSVTGCVKSNEVALRGNKEALNDHEKALKGI